MKKVYVSMVCDLVHAGHIKILKRAASLGQVTVGLLTAEAIEELGERAFLKYSQRQDVLESLSFVSSVIPQSSASYKENLAFLKPDFVVHGDDWITGSQSRIREEVLSILNDWNGELVEVPYSREISDTSLKNQLLRLGITGQTRQARLRQALKLKPIIRIMESHNALSALIVENAEYDNDGKKEYYDGFWSSSLTESTAKGKPDIEAVDLTSRLAMVNDIFEVTTKPMIFDADTGGKIEHFEIAVRSLERAGVSAVVIEDKKGLKKNSLFGNEVDQMQDSIEDFCNKIKAGKSAQVLDDMMIVARIESLILEAGMDDALERAFAYIEAGADAIMIHSRHKDPEEIKIFMRSFREKDDKTPVVVVPTSFNSVTIDEFEEMGVNIVIYANHMLRSAYPAMLKIANNILKDKRSLESEDLCMSIPDLLEFIPGTK
jgi:phosphoenolpyruvate phosphomutase / 2-hydroxyethylphosphonate cytidylyltransferase